MLEVFVKYLCSVMLTCSGIVVIKNINKEKVNVLTLPKFIILLFLLLIPALTYSEEYSSLNTILVLCINIMIYRIIFKKSITETIWLSSIVMILSFIADIINALC